MLNLQTKEKELWDEVNNKFIKVPAYELHLEHSLIALSKWEEKFEKPFLTDTQKTNEELIEYIKFMSIDQNIPDVVFEQLSQEELIKIEEYMKSKHTATWFREEPNSKRGPQEIITSEVIYYWMTDLRIPWKCEKWHLNRLLTLVRVINEKHNEQYGDKKKMSKQEIMARNKALNAQRRKQLNSKG